MAQNFPESPTIIYDTIIADATAMSLIGTYEFKGSPGTTFPAVFIITPGKDLPSLKEVKGVEVVIHDIADIRRRDYLTNFSDILTTWKVFIMCWDDANGSDVNALISRLMLIFSGSTSIETFAVEDGLGANFQLLLQIPSDMPILTP